MVFDATSLYPCSVYDGNSIYPQTEISYAFTNDMNDRLVDFNHKSFNRSAILRIKFYNPPNIKLQHVPITEDVNKTKVSTLINGYIVDTFTTANIQEFVKIGGKVISKY